MVLKGLVSTNQKCLFHLWLNKVLASVNYLSQQIKYISMAKKLNFYDNTKPLITYNLTWGNISRDYSCHLLASGQVTARKINLKNVKVVREAIKAVTSIRQVTVRIKFDCTSCLLWIVVLAFVSEVQS